MSDLDFGIALDRHLEQQYAEYQSEIDEQDEAEYREEAEDDINEVPEDA